MFVQLNVMSIQAINGVLWGIPALYCDEQQKIGD